jgi:short subunit dehydrogenase-like uncharacterized protein
MKGQRNETIILYGAYGYTGQLIARECSARALHIILAGRNEKLLKAQSMETGYPFEVVDLSDSAALKNLLLKGRVVIHCAGPFQFTAQAMVETCLETGTHYTDITGEYQVFEMLATYHARAKEAGITILPGTGFDVVPSDCLALYLKTKLPSANRLELAFTSNGGLSRGTARTMVYGLGTGSVIREQGVLANIPLGKKIINIDFGKGSMPCLNIPWGDVSTAWHSTGIPDIAVYTAVSAGAIRAVRLTRHLQSMLKTPWVKNMLLSIVDRRVKGPGAQTLNGGRSLLWGKVQDAAGKTAVATIETLSGYKLTSKTSVLIAGYILRGNFKSGFQTPANAYGPDLILQIENTKRTLLTAPNER